MKNRNECCPLFDPEKWEGEHFNWQEKKFIIGTIPTLFHIPFPPMIGKKIAAMWKLVEESGAAPEKTDDTLVLFRDPTPFKSEILISVSKEVNTTDNILLSGKFTTKVFDGGYNKIPVFIKEMEKYLETEGEKALDYYVHYAYCPRCVKKYGHNYILLLAKTE